jgi:capsular polysaccharide biosynthesis protein
LPDSTDPKPTDDAAANGRPDVPLLADVVEVARESYGADEAGAPAKPTPPAPTPPPPAAAKPEPKPQPAAAAPPAPAPTPTPAPAPPTPAPAAPVAPKVEAPKPEPKVEAPKVEAPKPEPKPEPKVVAAPVAAAAPAPSAWREPSGMQFQLLSYLRSNKKRVLWMVVAPILAAEAALFLLAIGPSEYKATATVTIPSEGSSVSDVTQSVSDYRALVKSNTVARQVAAQTQAKASSIKNGVTSKRQGASSLVDVTYTGTKKANVVPVVKAVSRESLVALIKPELEVADRSVRQGQEDYATVQQQIIEFNASHGLLLDPPETYRAKVGELGRLKVQAAQARSEGNGARAASLDAAVVQATKDVESLAKVVREYQALQSKKDQLQATINSASNKQAEQRARLDAANAASSVDVGGLKKVNALVKTARAGAITFVVALLLMVGALVMLEMFGSGRGDGSAPFASGVAPQPNPNPVRSQTRSRGQKKRRR